MEIPDRHVTGQRTPGPARVAGWCPPTLTPAEAEAVDEILAVFNGFRELEIELYANPNSQAATDRYPEFVAEPYLGTVGFEVRNLVLFETVREGHPTWDPTVLDVKLDERPPTATIRDCFDATDRRPVHRETGEPVEDDTHLGVAPGRHVMTYEVVRSDEGWRLVGMRILREERC